MKVTKTIEVEMMYECGRCGNGQRKTHTSQDGLLQVPKIYCGNCTKGRGLVLMSETFVSVKSSDSEDTEVRQFDVEREEVDKMKAQIAELQNKLNNEQEKDNAVLKQLPSGGKHDNGSEGDTGCDREVSQDTDKLTHND